MGIEILDFRIRVRMELWRVIRESFTFESGHLRVKFSRMVRCQCTPWTRSFFPTVSTIHLQGYKTFTNHFRENFFFFFGLDEIFILKIDFSLWRVAIIFRWETGRVRDNGLLNYLVGEKYSSNRFQKKSLLQLCFFINYHRRKLHYLFFLL